MDDYISNLILDNIKNNKWWRLFNLKGKTLKLIRPISEEYFPSYKGDRNFITIQNYIPDLGHHFSNSNYQGESVELYLYSDWVLFENDLNTDKTHSIHLKLLDFNYFKTSTDV